MDISSWLRTIYFVRTSRSIRFDYNITFVLLDLTAIGYTRSLILIIGVPYVASSWRYAGNHATVTYPGVQFVALCHCVVLVVFQSKFVITGQQCQWHT